jgi:Fur family peroxide stress response transcriptional regulator
LSESGRPCSTAGEGRLAPIYRGGFSPGLDGFITGTYLVVADHPQVEMLADPAPDQARRLAHLTEVARDAGVRMTHQRLEIFRELVASTEHPDAESIFRAVQRRVPTVSLDTVYRTLWRLHELGLVVTLGPSYDRARFDANLDHHHHYVCTRCGLVRDFVRPEAGAGDERDHLIADYVPDGVRALGTITDAHVEVRGVCAACVATASRKEPDLP